MELIKRDIELLQLKAKIMRKFEKLPDLIATLETARDLADRQVADLFKRGRESFSFSCPNFIVERIIDHCNLFQLI